MAYYGNHPNGGKSRFRFGFKDPQTDQTIPRTNPTPFAKSDPGPDPNHVCKPVVVGPDGRAMPVTNDCPPGEHYHTHMKTMDEYNAYQVQPASPSIQSYVAGERRAGFPRGFFQRPRPEYTALGPTLMTNDGWARPSPAGWKLSPETPLSKVTNDIETAADNLRESTAGPVSSTANDLRESMAGPVSSNKRWGAFSEFVAKKVNERIDSREAVKKYGGKYV